MAMDRNRVNPFRRQAGLIRGRFRFHKGLQTGLAHLEAHPKGHINHYLFKFSVHFCFVYEFFCLFIFDLFQFCASTCTVIPRPVLWKALAAAALFDQHHEQHQISKRLIDIQGKGGGLYLNKLTRLEATLVRNYDRSTYPPTDGDGGEV